MSATDINDWPGHPDADPDCECCLGDGLQADGETPCPCIDARKGEDLTFETETPRAWLDVMGERVRQITAEGWTPEHDDSPPASDAVARLVEAARAGLNYLENTEGEFGITLGSATGLRAALAAMEASHDRT